MITEEEAFKKLIAWIKENITWESYGYYGPLVYSGPLLSEIYSIAGERGVILEPIKKGDDE
jgi:hypothetical protein